MTLDWYDASNAAALILSALSICGTVILVLLSAGWCP